MMLDKSSRIPKLVRILGMLGLLLGPVVALAAGGGEHHADSGVIIKDFAYRCFNFALMVGLLAYFVRKPIRNGLRSRREEIEKTLAEAQVAKAAAEAKYREYSEKLERATEEIEKICVSIRREGELERDKILESAREMSVKIQQEADSKASNAVAKARTELREEAGRLAIELAEELLKKEFSPTDQKRLVDEYMQKVGELH
jgi:F-type H+-transporting ATPase subunit b